MKRNLVVRLFALMAAIILPAAPLSAQSTATIQGTVIDTQSAAVPGATVVVRNTGTGVERTLVTDAKGSYVAASLPPGMYQVEISLAGFQTQTREVTLQVSQTRQLDVQVSVAAVAEQVNVTAEAPVIDTTTASVGTVVNQRTVQEIPLNGRHFVDLGLLIPGSVTPPQNGFLTAPLRGQGSFAFNTAGNRKIRSTSCQRRQPERHGAEPDYVQPSISTVRNSRWITRRSAPVRPQLGRHRQHRDALGLQPVLRRGVRVLPQRSVRLA
jgi:hypothetical protein